MQTAPNRIELRVAELPSSLAAEARWIESIGAAALAMFRLCRVRGVARLAAHDVAQRSAAIEARWGAAGGA